jgi:Flp pilus assembly protein TadG
MQAVRHRRPSFHQSGRGAARRGTYIVEFALVFPVFMVFLMGLVEFGHVNLVINTLNNAARIAARMGTVEDVTTAQVVNRVNEILGASFAAGQATVMVKDASVFDSAGVDASDVDYESLPNMEVKNADDSQLFLVRITVPYDRVALLPPFWAKQLNLVGQAVMRHE